MSPRQGHIHLSDPQLRIARSASLVIGNSLSVLSYVKNLHSNPCVVLPLACKSIVPALVRSNRQVPDHPPLEVGLLAVNYKFFPHLDGGVLADCDVRRKRDNLLTRRARYACARQCPPGRQGCQRDDGPHTMGQRYYLHTNIVSPACDGHAAGKVALIRFMHV